MMNFFSYLPKEVIEIIISWLPADSVVRLKCINKSWYALISALIKDPGFVAKNLHNVKNMSSLSLIFHQSDPNEFNTIRGLRDHAQPDISLLTSLSDVGEIYPIHSVIKNLGLTLSRDGGCRGSNWRVVCHCDGILCLDEGRFGQNTMVCNLALQEFNLLPKPKHPIKFVTIGTGFGYDSRTNKYKVVRIVYRNKKVEAEVHTLGSNSWRKIKICCDVLLLSQNDYMYWEGVCFWLMSELIEDQILSFDMSDEVFRIIPFPNNVQGRAFLMVQSDSLALFLSPKNRMGNVSDIGSLKMWVMDGYFNKVNDVKESDWCLLKHLVIEPRGLIGDYIPLKFWKSDELLLFDRVDKRVRSYNFQTQKLRSIIGADKDTIPFCCFYFKSLVSVKGRESTKLKVPANPRRSERLRLKRGIS